MSDTWKQSLGREGRSEKDLLLPKAETGMGIRFFAILGAIVLAAALFLVIPLTQKETPVKGRNELREMQLASLAPPKAPPPPEDAKVEKEIDPPKMQENFQELDLQ
ncbi:MAG: hypothetical protein AAGB46_18600, partial [Verrucomicrobiota bacterium]